MTHRYLEIAADLGDRIASGEWAPGTRLPGINVLAREYGAGNSAVNEAMAVLELEGLVTVRPHVGTVVSDPKAERHRLDVGQEVRRNELGYIFAKPAGHWGPAGTPAREWTACPDDVAELLQIEPGSQVFTRYRVVGPGGQPMQITTTYLVEDVARDTVLEESDTGPGGYLERLEQDMGHGPLSWLVDISTRLPTHDEAAALKIGTRLPVLQTLRIHTSTDGRPVAVDRVVVDGRRFSVRFPLQRGESAHWPVEPATGRNTPRPDEQEGSS